MAQSPILLALLITGLIGSLGHCLGMCGPLVLLMGARFPRQGLAAAPIHLLYHTGRITVYGLIGLAAGEIGALAWKVVPNALGPALLSLVFGAAVIFAGLAYLGWLRLPGVEKLGGWWRSLAKRVMRLPKLTGVILLGGLNGLLPCGLVYGALLTAAATGNPWLGGLGMLVFGLGTLPALLLLGVGTGVLTQSARWTMSRVSGVLVMLVGIQLMLRGAAAMGLVSHWMVGQVMVW